MLNYWRTGRLLWWLLLSVMLALLLRERQLRHAAQDQAARLAQTVKQQDQAMQALSGMVRDLQELPEAQPHCPGGA